MRTIIRKAYELNQNGSIYRNTSACMYESEDSDAYNDMQIGINK